ncbi:MAG: hypothetical protein AAGI17_00370 [Planctomycetota bacterium]
MLGLLASIACAQQPRVLLDRDLGSTSVEILELTPQGVVFEDDIGRRRTIGWDRLAAFGARPGTTARPAIPPGASGAVALIETIDGQRLIGRLLASQGEGGEALAIDLGGLGTASVPLDEISAIVLGAGRVLSGQLAREIGSRANPEDDFVALTNGDGVSGFVLAMGESIEIETEAGDRTIPLSRVAGIGLANARVSPEGPRVWLDDGSVLSIVPWLPAGGSLGLEQPEPMSLTADRVLAYAPDAGALDALAARPIARVLPDPTRRWTEMPAVGDVLATPLGAADISLPGPMAVDWRLQPEDARLAVTASLVRMLGGSPGPWADCVLRVEVVLSTGSVETLSSTRLTAGTPDATVSVELPGVGAGGRLLRLVLDAGEFGPVQDAVVLRGGLLGRD